MSWVKLDDAMGDHRKVKRALTKSRPAVALHFLGILHCSRYLTDGFVEDEYVAEVLPAREREPALDALVQQGLWTVVDGGYAIHDYLEHNPTREKVLAQRAADAARKARGRQSESRGKSSGVQADSDRTPDGIQAESVRPVPSRPVPSPKTALSDTSDVRAVFDEWIQVTDRSGRTVLSDKRRRLIRNALKLYPLPDVLDAVRGWRRSPHPRGENAQGTVYNDIELLLRDAANVERFRDLERGTGGRPVATGPVGGGPASVSDIQAAMAKTRSAA
jgi:hypothetical protein